MVLDRLAGFVDRGFEPVGDFLFPDLDALRRVVHRRRRVRITTLEREDFIEPVLGGGIGRIEMDRLGVFVAGLVETIGVLQLATLANQQVGLGVGL